MVCICSKTTTGIQTSILSLSTGAYEPPKEVKECVTTMYRKSGNFRYWNIYEIKYFLHWIIKTAKYLRYEILEQARMRVHLYS